MNKPITIATLPSPHTVANAATDPHRMERMTFTTDGKTYTVTSGPLPMQSSSMYRFDKPLTTVEVTTADGGKVGWTMIHTADANASTVLEVARGVLLTR